MSHHGLPKRGPRGVCRIYRGLRKSSQASIHTYAFLTRVAVQIEPNFRALGERLGKAMGAVGKAVKAMGHEEAARFQKEGKLTVQGHELGPDDVRSLLYKATMV